jgi:hypothetical protein
MSQTLVDFFKALQVLLCKTSLTVDLTHELLEEFNKAIVSLA